VHIRRTFAALVSSLAIDKAPPGAFMYVESGRRSFGRDRRGLSRHGLISASAQSWPAAEAIAAWGRATAVYSLGSNSRVRGHAAARGSAGSPTRHSITKWIAEELALKAKHHADLTSSNHRAAL